MTTYIVSYDLNRSQESDYKPIWDFLNAYPNKGSFLGLMNRSSLHLQKSVWIIQSEETADAIWEKIAPLIHQDESFFITQISQSSGNMAAGIMSKEKWEWINSHVDQR